MERSPTLPVQVSLQDHIRIDHPKSKDFKITRGKICTCCNKDISEPGKLAVAVERVGGKVQGVQVLPLDQVPG